MPEFLIGVLLGWFLCSQCYGAAFNICPCPLCLWRAINRSHKQAKTRGGPSGAR